MEQLNQRGKSNFQAIRGTLLYGTEPVKKIFAFMLQSNYNVTQ